MHDREVWQLMRIVDQKAVSNVNATRASSPTAGSSGARFSLPTDSPTQRAELTAPTSILGGLEALIAIKSEDQQRERKRRSVRRGQSLLDLLDELKLNLLSGRLPVELESRLSGALRDDMPSGDARLDVILDGIELRAAVELAKIRQAKAGAVE
jgi:hypothetical protein